MHEDDVRQSGVKRESSAPALLLTWGTLSLVSLALSGCGGGGGTGGGEALIPPLQDGPDLLPLSVTFADSSVAAGEAALVTDVVLNQGTRMTGPFSIAVYLSTDADIDTSDVLLGYRSLADLPVGEQSTGGGTVTIPGSTLPGTYYLGVLTDEFQEVDELDEANNTLASSTSLDVTPSQLPNLRVPLVELSQRSLEAGSALTVTEQVENLGVSNSGRFTVSIHLSTDPVITSTDPQIGSRSLDSLDANELSSSTLAYPVPLSIAPGQWYVGALADVASEVMETDELDNAAVAPTLLEVLAPPLPDLVADNLSVSPAVVDVGGFLQVSETVTNVGGGASDIAELSVYLSDDSIVTVDDRLIGVRSLPSLAVAESSSANSQFMIPPGISGGDYHVGVIADFQGVVSELEELNNAFTSVGQITVVVPPLPDLSMTGFSFTPGLVNAGAGGLLSVTDTVENQGVVASGSFRVSYFLSNNTAITASDILLGSRTLAGLVVGESSTAVTDLAIPSTVPSGSWFVGALADDLEVVLESTRGNNSIFGGSSLDVVASPDPMPDLEMANLNFSPSTVAAGATLQLLDRVINVGTLSSGTFHVGVYLSEDMEVTTDDVLVGERIVFNLSIDFGSASSFQAILPDNLAAGEYFVAAIADNRHVVSEALEDNNTHRTVGMLEVFVPPPPAADLVVGSVDFTPGSGSAGDTVTVSESVRNAGNLDASTIARVGYYLSEDEEVSTADTLVASRSVADLAADEESASTRQFSLPAGLASGDWYLGVIVDDLGVVSESNEDNNTRVATATFVIP